MILYQTVLNNSYHAEAFFEKFVWNEDSLEDNLTYHFVSSDANSTRGIETLREIKQLAMRTANNV